MKDTSRLHGGARRHILVLAGLALGFTAATALPGAATPVPSASPATGATAGWADAVQRDIEQREYEVTWQERPRVDGLPAAWHAPNRAHGFRTYFTDHGPRLIPRKEDVPTWQWGLRLHGIGRGNTLLPAAPAILTSRANRLTYDRGSVVEWYVNDRRGLEQGMTLSSPPEGHEGWQEEGATPAGSPLAVVFALDGDLSPVVGADGQTIDFVTPAGAPALRYAELTVTDAAGRLLPARMQGWNDAGARGIRLLIEDKGAVWPLTIDPLLTSPAWTAESDQAGSQFGVSVGTAGDVNGDGYTDVIVGAATFDNGQADEGRVFVYHGSASGLSLAANWTAESDQAGAVFGTSAGTAGDVNGDGYADVVVGAYLFDNGQIDEGRAYVYHGSAAGLALTANWTAEGNQAGGIFGQSVGTAGDVNGDGFADVIVGAYLFDNGQTDEGRVLVYHGSASGLSPSASWTAESDQAGAHFGVSAGTAGDVNGDGYADVVVGAYLFDNGETDEGRAFVYHGSASGLSLTASWTAESDQAAARFGISVDTAGDVNGDGYADVIVGANLFDNGDEDEGRAYVYHGSASGLLPVPHWTAESDQAGALFGHAVGTAGDVNGDGYADVIAGANYFTNGQAFEGRAFVYHGSASGLSLIASWTAESNQAGAFFGYAVGTAGDINGDGYADVLVGAYLFDSGQPDEGRAFVYRGSAMGLSLTAGWTAESDQADAKFGYAVGTAGDVNGDGYADVIVGAPYFDNGQIDEGLVLVYHGSALGLSFTAGWIDHGDQPGAQFGYSVGTAGDVNGDGYDDVVVGAHSFDNGQPEEGRAFVYHGSASGLSLTANWTAEGDQPNAGFGFAVGTAGDVNGDGYADVVVGAPFFDNGQFEEGRVFVYHGSASGLSPIASWTAESNQAGVGFGISAGTAGDVNGDGYSDVVAGAPYFDNGQVSEGRVFVYHGSASGLSLTANWTAESDQPHARFGRSAGTAGDVNGDGYADVIVGAYFFDNGQTDEGRVFVYHGSASGLSFTASWTAESDQVGAWFGTSVGTAGDVNGDGYADVVVGADSFDNGQADEGRAFVYHGSASGLSLAANWTAEGDQASAALGTSAGTAGDVNGDGYADLVVGAIGFGNDQVNEGRAFLYYGNGGPGLALRPQQRRSDDTAPISPQGASDSHDSFRLAVLRRTPFGRGGVALEWEVKPLGSLLDGSGTLMGPGWIDSGAGDPPLNAIVTGLPSGTAFHWRLRLRYDPATTPLAAHSRWFTVPWNGWQEADLRTPLHADLAVSQAEGADPILFGSGNLTYTMNVTNSGPDGVSVKVTDNIPAGSAFVSATPSQGSCGAPAGGVVTCVLGPIASGGGASVLVTVTSRAPGIHTNIAAVTFTSTGFDPVQANNTSAESTTVTASAGDRVWEDSAGDGIQDPGEPGVAGVLVILYDGAGFPQGVTLTDTSGAYSLPGLSYGATYRLRFVPPPGYLLVPKDQGGDDAFDSDADPLTQFTPAFSFVSVQDPFRWDAGLVPEGPGCLPPDEPIFIYQVTLTTDGNSYPVLHYQDPNQPDQVTGYNVRRSSNPALPKATWPIVASNVIDMDEATPNRQWVDTSGAVPPGGVWYYQVTGFNSRCPAEGPF